MPEAEFRLKVAGSEEIQRKVDDLKKSIEDVKDAADDLKGALDDGAKGLDNLKDAASDADKDLKDAKGAIEDVNDAASDVKTSLGDADKGFSDLASSANDAVSDIRGAVDVFEDVTDKADASVSGLDAVGTSFSGVSESAVEADQNIRAATEGLEGVGTATESAAAGADSLASSLDNITASAQEAESNITAAANGIDGIGTSIGEAQTALDGLGSAFDGAGTATTTFNDVLSSTGSQAQAASGGLTPLNTVLGNVGGSAQTSSSGFQGLNANMGTAIGFFGTAASAGLQVVSALNSIHGAQIKVEAASNKLSKAQEAVEKAQAKLNELYASGSASTEELAQAKLDLEQATSNAATAAGKLDKAQTDLNLKYARFGTDVLPGVIQSVTSTIAVVSQLHDKLDGVNWSAVAAGAGGVAAAIMTIVEAIELLNAQSIATEFFDADTLDEKIKKMKEFRESIRDIPVVEQIQGPKLDEDIKQLELLKKGYEDLGIPIPKVSENLSTYTQNTNQATGGTQTLNQELSLTEPQALSAAEGIGTVTKQQQLLEESAKNTVGPLNEQKKTHEELKETIAAALPDMQNYQDNIAGMVTASEPLNAAIQEQIGALDRQTEAMNNSVTSGDAIVLQYAELENSIATHNQNIAQLTETLTTQEGQMKSHENAVLAGKEAFLQWLQSSRDAAAEAASFKASLEDQVRVFGELPGWMEGTVEEMQAFIESQEQGGEAAEKFEEMALESWRSLVSAAEPLFNDLKSAWKDVFSGETMNRATDAINKANEQISRNIAENQQTILDAAGEAVPKLKDIYEGVDWQSVADAVTDPLVEAFNKLPPAVSDTLDQTEREALSFQAMFAQISEMAGTTFATNLQAGVAKGLDFKDALPLANQAVADMLAPFIAEHPELANMMKPLFDELAQAGPKGGQAVAEVLEKWSGLPGPIGQVSKDALSSFRTEFADQLPGAAKGGVEGAVSTMESSIVAMLSILGNQMEQGFQDVVDAINNKINTGIKQDPANVPEITANTNPANEAIQLIGTSLDQMKTYLAENPLSITVTTDAANTALDGLNTKIDGMAGKNVTITVDTGPAGLAIDGLQQRLDAMAGKNVTITVDTGPAGIAITGLQTQIDGVHGTNVQITVDTGPAGLAITEIQGKIDAVHGTEVAVTVDTGAAGLAITEIQSKIDGVTGKNVTITVDIGAALAAIQQLQSAINAVSSSMAGMAQSGGGGYGYGGGYGGGYPQYAFASGFGPAVINKPTRLLVGEAGPEFVSVIPMKRKVPEAMTAAAGMGQQYPWNPTQGTPPSGLYGGFGSMQEYDAYNQQQKQMMDAARQGTQQGMSQGMGDMQQAVQEGAQQGIEQGMQQAPQGYPMAPSNTEIFGAGRFTWTGGAMGTNYGMAGGGGMGGGAQYPVAPSNTHLWGRPQKFTWTGGAMGTNIPGLGGFGGGGSSGGGMMPWPPGGGMGRGLVSPPAQKKAYADLIASDVANKGQIYGTGEFHGWRYEHEYKAHLEKLIAEANKAGASAGNGFASSFGSGMSSGMKSTGPIAMGTFPGGGSRPPAKPLNIGDPGYPGVYTGTVPASYGKPLGQLINGIAATILPGQGPRGARQAQLGMHEFLKRDTLIKAHRNERVDITPPGRAGPESRAGSHISALEQRLEAMSRLLSKLASQQPVTNVSFEVDGRMLSRVASKHTGTAGYGDR